MKDCCRTCECRNSLSSTDELAVELRDNKADSLSSACRVRYDVSSTSSCSLEVTLSLRTVEDHLVACVSVNCCHDTALDSCIIIESLCHRSKAVCCAGSCRDDLVISCECCVVNVVNDCRKIVACRSRDNNLLSTGIDVSLCLFLRCVETGALENYVNTELAPRTIVCIGFLVDLKQLAVNCDCVSLVVRCNCVLILTEYTSISALSCVILEKVSEHGRLCKIVDSYNLITLSAEHLSESKTTDTTETVNRNFYCHIEFLLNSLDRDY